MSRLFAAALLALSSASTAQAAILTCNGFKLIGAGDSVANYQVVLEHESLDRMPGAPILVTVNYKLDSNTATPSSWAPIISNATGRHLGDIGSKIDVSFSGGSLHVRQINSGVIGSRRSMDGFLYLDGHDSIHVNCPLLR